MAYAICYLVLGFLLLRGTRLASFGLMALSTVGLLIVMKCYWVVLDKPHYAMHVSLSILGWALYMHALYNALCVERERKGSHEPA